MNSIQNIKANLRTILTLIGAIIVQYDVASNGEIDLWLAFLFPFLSGVWAIIDGEAKNVNAWTMRLLQTATPIIVYYGWLGLPVVNSLSSLLAIILMTNPNEKENE